MCRTWEGAGEPGKFGLDYTAEMETSGGALFKPMAEDADHLGHCIPPAKYLIHKLPDPAKYLIHKVPHMS